MIKAVVTGGAGHRLARLRPGFDALVAIVEAERSEQRFLARKRGRIGAAGTG